MTEAKIEATIEYLAGCIVVTFPYNGDPTKFPVSASGKSHTIINDRFKPCPGCPDPNALVSFSVNSMIRKGKK